MNRRFASVLMIALPLCLMVGSALAHLGGAREGGSGGSSTAAADTGWSSDGTTTTTTQLVTTNKSYASTASSGNYSSKQLTNARIGLITGDGDYLSCSGTTCTFTGTGISADGVIASSQSLNAATLVQAGTYVEVGTVIYFDTSAGARVAFDSALPTISGGCTSPTVTHGSTVSFQIDVGTSCTGVSTVVIGLPSRTNGWSCHADNITAPSTRVVAPTSFSQTSMTFTNFSRTLGTAADFADGADIVISCTGR